MKKTFTKALALVLALLMLMTAVPMGVFAVDPINCDHSYELVPATEAKANKHGNTKYYKCPTCGACFATPGGAMIKESTTVIHYYSHWNPTDSEEDQKALVSAATCQKKAVYYKKCCVKDENDVECGLLGTETFEYGELSGHEATDWLVPSGADCTVAGFTESRWILKLFPRAAM